MLRLRSAEARGRRGGFTILELAISLALITIVAVFAIPTYYAQPTVTLDNASVLLARDLRYAQNEAAMRGVDTRVRFDSTGDGYLLETANSMPLPNPIGGADLVRSYSRDAVFEGVRITRLEGPTDRVVRFDRNGFCLDGAIIELHYEDEVRVLYLNEGSGMARIEGLTESWSDDGL